MPGITAIRQERKSRVRKENLRRQRPFSHSHVRLLSSKAHCHRAGHCLVNIPELPG